MDYSRLEGFILDKISKYKMPSLVIGLLRDGNIVYTKGFGYKDIESSQPPTPRTNYGIGSVTKSYTAMSIMQLYEKGLVDVHDPVYRYVDVVRDKDITIHHLLTHTSGIPALAYAEALIDSYYGLGGPWLPISTPEDVLTYMRDYEEWIRFKPGERWFYLNEGYVLLGRIIEKVTGVKYEDYVKQNILSLIKADKTYFSSREFLEDPDKATPYLLDQDGRLVKKEPLFGISSDGGLFSNIVDLLKYANMLIDRGIYEGRRVLDAKLVELMEKPYTKLPYESPTSRYYGYGLIIQDDFHGRKLVGHSGSVLVYTAYLGYIQNEKIAVAVLSNASGYPLSLIGAYALTLLLDLDPEEKLPFVKHEKILDKLEGVYTGYKNSIQVKVKKAGGTLVLEDPVRKTQTPLYPEKVGEDYALFYYYTIASKIPVEFIIEKHKVTMINERYVLVKQW